MSTNKEKLEERMSKLEEEIEMLDKSYELNSSHVNDLKEKRDKLMVANEAAERMSKMKLRVFFMTEEYQELQQSHQPVTQLFDEINSELCTLMCADCKLDDVFRNLHRRYTMLQERCKMEVDLLKQEREFLKKQQKLVEYKPEERLEACEIDIQKWLDLQQKVEALLEDFPPAKRIPSRVEGVDTPPASDEDTSEDSSSSSSSSFPSGYNWSEMALNR